MMQKMKKYSLLVLALTSLFVSNSYGQTNFNFNELKIDSALHLIPIGDHTLRDPNEGPYYFIFHGAWVTSINHFEKKPGIDGREVLFYLETGQNNVLDRTVKMEEILKGDFGTVYSTKTCFYASPLVRGYSSVSVGAGNNETGHEIPSELSRSPKALPPLTSLSLIRVFRVAPGYRVVGANYEVSGKLRRLNISSAKSGDRSLTSDDGDYFDDMSSNSPFFALTKKYGIPIYLNVQKYLRSRRQILPAVLLPETNTVVDLHYGHDKVIRQDTLEDGATVSSRLLQPSVTEEEKTLDPLCEERFRQQETGGFPTVQ